MSEFKIKNDELDRGRYARSICRIIADYSVDANGKVNKRLDGTDNESFVMAISAEWGFGKTTFVNMLKQVLIGTGVQDDQGANAYITHFKGIVPLNESQVSIYNAWKNDYFNNALEPLFYTLADTIFAKEIVDEAKAKKLKTAIEFFKKLTLKTVSGVVTMSEVINGTATPESIAVNATGQAASTTASEIGDTVKKVEKFSDKEKAMEYIFDDYADLNEQIKNLQDMLKEEVKAQGKVVIIIDELDRCKPDFAVQTLELVKHLFNIPGIVYIFSLDITQLQHCVKTVYGNDFDAVGYLERFFDYITLLPKGNRSSLFKSLAKNFAVIKDIEDPQGEAYFNIAEQFALSAREMKAILAPFSFLLEYELKGYNDIAKQVYFYLYILKYKEPVKIMQVNSNKTIHVLDAQDSEKANNEESDDAVRRRLLRKYPLKLSVPNGVLSDVTQFDAIFEVNPVIKDGTYIFIDKNGTPNMRPLRMDQISASEKLNSDESLSFVLYAPDYAHLDEIQEFRILEYMYRKIELYDTLYVNQG